MIRRPPRSTQSRSSAASDVYKRQSLLSCWKLFDNLRRSLVAPSLLVLLFCALIWVPNPFYWLGVVTLVWLLPAVLSITHDLLRKPPRRPLRQHLSLVVAGALKRLSRIALNFTILPHEAGYTLYAIGVTLWRLAISRRNLSQWASHNPVSDQVKVSAVRFYRAMWLNVVSGIASVSYTHLTLPTIYSV